MDLKDYIKIGYRNYKIDVWPDTFASTEDAEGEFFAKEKGGFIPPLLHYEIDFIDLSDQLPHYHRNLLDRMMPDPNWLHLLRHLFLYINRQKKF